VITGSNETNPSAGKDVAGADGPVFVTSIAAGTATAVSVTGTTTNTTVSGQYGSLALDGNGDYTYTVSSATHVAKGSSVIDTFTYTIVDADGMPSSTTLTVTVNGTDNAPTCVVSSQTDTVYEAGLATIGSHAGNVSYPTSGSDQLQVGDTNHGGLGDIQAVTITVPAGTVVGTSTLSAATSYTLTSAGLTFTEGDVTVHVSGFNSTTGQVSYSYTLTGVEQGTLASGQTVPTDPPATFTATVTDTANQSASATATINVIDDMPQAHAIVTSQTATQGINTNLMITLDTSGSMSTNDTGIGLTRLQAAVESILKLMADYQALGNVEVELVTFNSSATNTSGGWVSVATAKAELLSLVAGGTTDYDSAINMDAGILGSGVPQTGAGTQTVGYFMSDGYPNQDGVSGTNHGFGPTQQGSTPIANGLSPTEQATWDSDLAAVGARQFALGYGEADITPLQSIAYNGTAQLVSNFNQLSTDLANTVSVSPITGTLVGGSTGNTFGADGAGHVYTITVDSSTGTAGASGSTTFAYVLSGTTVEIVVGAALDPTGHVNNSTSSNTHLAGTSGTLSNGDTWSFSSSHVLTVTDANGGTLVVNMDGSSVGQYTYTPSASVSTMTTTFTDTFGYSLIDSDGGVAGSTLAVSINPAQQPVVARDDYIVSDGTFTLDASVVAQVLLANDTNGTTIATVTPATEYQNLISGSGTVSVAAGSFSYTDAGALASSTDSGNVTVTNVSGATVQGTQPTNTGVSTAILGEILVGLHSGDTLVGGVGNNILIADLGNGTTTGLTSNETITMTGGGATTGSPNDASSTYHGQDTYMLVNGDYATSGHTMTATVTDFNPVISSTSTPDVLDLHDLLQGAHSGLGSAAYNLDGCLLFTTSGSQVVLDIAHAGTTGSVSSATDAQIVFKNYTTLSSFAEALGLSSSATSTQIIEQMIAHGILKTNA